MREHAPSACALERARNVAFQGTSLHTLVMMAANGLGVTLAPEKSVEAGILRGLALHVAPLEGRRASSPHRACMAPNVGTRGDFRTPCRYAKSPSGKLTNRWNRL